MNIQAKTNEELRTKLSNLLQEKILYGSNRKLAAGLVVANEKLQNKEKEKAQPNSSPTKNLLFKIKKRKSSRISCCQYRTCSSK
jgi:hypothetical protein